jgi:syntaxin-binding protein 1
MEIDDKSLYESFRYRVLDEIIEEIKLKSGFFIMIVDKKSLGIISNAVSVLDLTQRGVTVIEQLEKSRKPMPEVDALYFLTPTYKSINRLTVDFIEQAPYRQVHLFFTGKISDKSMRSIANSSVMPYIKTFKEANCGFRIIGRDCFSLETSGLFGSLYLSKSSTERKEILSYISKNLTSVCGVMKDLPYVCYQSSSALCQELALYLEDDITELYRKLPDIQVRNNRPILVIMDRNYDLATPLIHDIHYEAILKDIFEVGPDGKVKYESIDNSGLTTVKETFINEKDTIWTKLRYEEIDVAQHVLNQDLIGFRNENQAIEKASGENETDLKTMAKIVSGLSNYNELINKYAVHRYLLESCMKTFAEAGINNISEIEQMILTGFDTEKAEYKESDVLKKILKVFGTLTNNKEKLRLALLSVIGINLSASDRKAITDQLPSEFALNIAKLSSFGLSLEAAGKSRKRLDKLYINALQSRTPNITKIYSYAVPKLSDIIFAAIGNTLEAEGFVFGKSSPPNVQNIQPEVKSLRKKQAGVSRNRKKVIVFIIGGISNAELRVCKDFSDVQVVLGGTKVMAPLEFVEELMSMSKNSEVPDIDPRDIELDFR